MTQLIVAFRDVANVPDTQMEFKEDVITECEVLLLLALGGGNRSNVRKI